MKAANPDASPTELLSLFQVSPPPSGSCCVLGLSVACRTVFAAHGAGTRLVPTSGLGMGASPLPHMHRDWCSSRCSPLHWDCAHPLHHDVADSSPVHRDRARCRPGLAPGGLGSRAHCRPHLRTILNRLGAAAFTPVFGLVCTGKRDWAHLDRDLSELVHRAWAIFHRLHCPPLRA